MLSLINVRCRIQYASKGVFKSWVMVSQYYSKLAYSTRATVHLLIIRAGWHRTSIDVYNKEILFMVIMNLLWTYNIVSVGYVCPRNVSQCTATQCMCYKDIQMKEGTFKRKKDKLSSYSTKSIFYQLQQ